MMLVQLARMGIVTGTVFLCTLSLASADQWPGDGGFDAICREIIDDVARNAIQFRQLDGTGNTRFTCQNRLRVREVMSRIDLCNRLIAQHNIRYGYN